MATNYGDISHRTACYAVKQMLKNAESSMITNRFGAAKDIPKWHPDYDWIDEVEDALFICTGCGVNECDFAEPHVPGELPVHTGCYDPQILDTQVGEHITGHVDWKSPTIKFSRYGEYSYKRKYKSKEGDKTL